MVVKKTNLHWWEQRRRDAALTAVVALILTYAFASWAIDTGSLLQYGVAFLLLSLFCDRIVMAVRNP